MTNAERTRSNALRLAAILKDYANIPQAVRITATALGYHQPQLQEDMKAVYEYIKYLEDRLEKEK